MHNQNNNMDSTSIATINEATINEYSVTHTANGIRNTFFYPYNSNYAEEIQVFINSKLIESYDTINGYSVDGNHSVSGGFIVFNNPPPKGSKIMICDNISFKKIVNFFASSAFTSQDLNREFTNVYKILGILNKNHFRTLRMSNSDSLSDLSDLQDGLIMKSGAKITTKAFDIPEILAKLDDVSHKYDDLKIRLINAFNRISSTSGTGTTNVIKNALVSQNNLNDLIDVKQARHNLGLGDISTVNKITSSHTDNSILTQNLANISDPATARQNLMLGDMVTMSKGDVTKLIEDKVNEGFNFPVLATSVYSINNDISPKISLSSDKYQQIPFSSHDYDSSLTDKLYISDNNLDVFLEASGIYTLNGYVSVHGAYNVVAKIEVRNKSDSALIDTFISNHVTSTPEASTPGLCIFNELLSLTDPAFLRIFLMGDESQNANLMLDTPLDKDYLAKFTFLRILT